MSHKKYFRVGAYYKDENSKSVIVQCYDRNEAEGWIPKAKAMLFPEEKAEALHARVFEFQLQIGLNNLNHYRITVERPANQALEDALDCPEDLSVLDFNAIVEAEDKESAKAKFLEEHFAAYADGKRPEEYTLYVDEVPLAELIESEERMLRHRLISNYAREHYGDLSVREFSRMMRDDASPLKSEMLYKGLKSLLQSIRTAEYLEKRLDIAKLSHEEFCQIRDALCVAKIGEDFERINRAATERYGRAGIIN